MPKINCHIPDCGRVYAPKCAQNFWLNRLAFTNELGGTTRYPCNSFYKAATAGIANPKTKYAVGCSAVFGKLQHRRFVANLAIGKQHYLAACTAGGLSG